MNATAVFGQLGLTGRRGASSRQRIAFLSPHPDDIELSAGIAIDRLVAAGHRVIAYYITDGAPARSVLTRLGSLKSGYHRSRYRAVRRTESSAAARLLGIKVKDTHFLHYPDLETHLHIPALVSSLERVVENCDVIFSCPFEGGHPDHDITRFCLAAAIDGSEMQRPVFEYASYNHKGYHYFADSLPPSVLIRADASERRRKRRVRSVFFSQRSEARLFSIHSERLRHSLCEAPLQTYAAPRGARYYERFAHPESQIIPFVASYLQTRASVRDNSVQAAK